MNLIFRYIKTFHPQAQTRERQWYTLGIFHLIYSSLDFFYSFYFSSSSFFFDFSPHTMKDSDSSTFSLHKKALFTFEKREFKINSSSQLQFIFPRNKFLFSLALRVFPFFSLHNKILLCLSQQKFPPHFAWTLNESTFLLMEILLSTWAMCNQMTWPTSCRERGLHSHIWMLFICLTFLSRCPLVCVVKAIFNVFNKKILKSRLHEKSLSQFLPRRDRLTTSFPLKIHTKTDSSDFQRVWSDLPLLCLFHAIV